MNDTHKKILDVVIKAIKHGTIESISMSKIASEALIGKSTIYEHYSSKDELIVDAIKSIHETYLDRILSSPMDNSAYECFREHLSIAIEIGMECENYADILRNKVAAVLDISEVRVVSEYAMSKIFERIGQIYQKFLDEGVVKPKRSLDVLTKSFWSLLLGSLMCYYSFYDNSTKDQFIKDCYDNALCILNN